MRALLVLLFMAVSIQWGFAQLNLNVSRGTLGTVIEQIKSQSKYQFFYDDKLAALSVENVKVNNVSIEDALMLFSRGRTFRIKWRTTSFIFQKRPLLHKKVSNRGKSGLLPESYQMIWGL